MSPWTKTQSHAASGRSYHRSSKKDSALTGAWRGREARTLRLGGGDGSSSAKFRSMVHLGCDIGGAKEPGVIYFPTNWGAKEPQNLPNHRVVMHVLI